MDRFAPIPAEEYSDSDDELMFALSDQTQDHRIANVRDDISALAATTYCCIVSWCAGIRSHCF